MQAHPVPSTYGQTYGSMGGSLQGSQYGSQRGSSSQFSQVRDDCTGDLLYCMSRRNQPSGLCNGHEVLACQGAGLSSDPLPGCSQARLPVDILNITHDEKRPISLELLHAYLMTTPCGAGDQGQQGYSMQSPQQVPQWAQSAIASQAAFGGQAQQYAQQAEVPVAAVPVRRPGGPRA